MPTSFGDDDSGVRNGFKDVFNGSTSRSLKYDDIEYIDKEENVFQTKVSVEQSDEKSDRKLKVGNKKTDKFFGESLSDHLSDEPVSPVEEKSPSFQKDELDRTSSDKKLFFLMNMLAQDFEETEKYKDQTPIEEPLFVARKKEVKRHICDDDDHMHSHRFHGHDHDHHEHEPPSDYVSAPPKPDRDFSKYQTKVDKAEQRFEIPAEASQVEAEKVEEVLIKPQVKKSLSRENLPTPPEAPKRKSGINLIPGTPGTPTITIESIDFDTPDESISKFDKKQLNRSSSNESWKTPEADRSFDESSRNSSLNKEIADHLMKKAFGLHDFNPEDSEHNHDDGSNLAAPTSKLTTRKISVSRKTSTDSLHSSDSESIVNSKELFPPGTPRKKISLIEDPLMRIIESQLGTDQFELEQERAIAKAPSNKPRNYEKLLIGTSVNDIIEEIYSKNSEVMQEFQSYLEQTIEQKPVLSAEEKKEFLKATGVTDRDFIRTPEPPKLGDNEDESCDNQSYSDSFESTDTEQETIPDMGKISSSHLPKFNTRRRESIEDVDGWFNNHLELEQKKSEICGIREGLPTGAGGYDTHKIFPFGRVSVGRRDSMSDEFFSEASQPSASLGISPLAKESENSVSDEKEKNEGARSKERSPDHSTLLKFLDKESKVN